MASEEGPQLLFVDFACSLHRVGRTLLCGERFALIVAGVSKVSYTRYHVIDRFWTLEFPTTHSIILNP